MSSLTAFSARDVRRAITTFSGLLRAQREVINRLNVYPVPDGDTGTNMALTMQAVADALANLDESATLADVGRTVATTSLMAARGNSGVILSQMVRGWTASFPEVGEWRLADLQAGLVRADELARAAVSHPVEGTILSVARAAARGAQPAATLLDAVRHARDAAKEALARTPEQLDVLRQAGVVDSGGTGLVLWFDALCHVAGEDELPVAPALSDAPDVVSAIEPSALASLRYEVMFLLEAADDDVPRFRTTWEALGDSIVIVGGEGLHNCHIHTDLIGPAIEAGIAIGRPFDIRVTDLLEQSHTEPSRVPEPASLVPAPATAVVAVATGDGLAQLFRSLGASQIVVGGQTMNPSTAELVAAVRATNSPHVILLPNNKNIMAVAQQVNALVEVDVHVVATRSVVEGLAAMVGYRPDEDGEKNHHVMTEFAAHVVAGEVTQAVRDTSSDVGAVRVGDWIGLGPTGISSVASSLLEAAQGLLWSLSADGPELLTVVTGEGADATTTDALRRAVVERWPEVSVEMHDGGQPLYPYLFGLE